jgi:hypothetical protein
MASWKKVVVSGSAANFLTLQVDNLTSGQVVIGGGASTLTTTAINGTGNILATSGATNVSISGSFTGSFRGDGSGLTGVTATATFPTTPKTDISGSDQFYINDGANKYVTYASLLNNLTGSNITVSGKTLALSSNVSGLTSVNATSFTGSSFTGSFSGSFSGDGRSLTNITSSFIGSSAITSNIDNYVLTATGGGTINGEANLTFNGSLLSVTGDVVVSNNLTVNGTTTFINTTNTYIKDQLLLLSSGSTSLNDGGIVIAYSGSGVGSALFLESTTTGPYGRWAVAYEISGSATTIAADEYVTTVKISPSSAPSSAPTWGSASNGSGNMWIKNDTGDIYIYA